MREPTIQLPTRLETASHCQPIEDDLKSKTTACICQQISLIAFIINTIALLILYDMSHAPRRQSFHGPAVLSSICQITSADLRQLLQAVTSTRSI